MNGFRGTICLVVICGWQAILGAQEMQLDPALARVQQQRVETIARATAAAISVFGPGGRGGGSGVVVSPDGYALTNFHVVRPCGNYMRCSMPDGRLYDAVIVGLDPTGDLALIKLLGRDDFPAATMGDSDLVRAGQECFAVGNPFLLATNFEPSVSWGIVSGVRRYQYPSGTLLEYTDCIQTDAAINPGNSGGPLFDAEGRLIGINGRISLEKRGRVNVGVGYAISINQARNFMDHLRSGRIVDHATLGATVATQSSGKVEVNNLLDTSDAYRRGLRYGDEVISIAGRQVQTANDVKNILGTFPKGWRVPVTLRREGKEQTIVVRLEGLHSEGELAGLAQNAPRDPDERAPDSPLDDPPKTTVPQYLSKMIDPRPGFANYFFNQWQRDDVWRRFLVHGDPMPHGGKWTIRAKSADNTPVRIVLTDRQSALSWGEQAFVLEDQLDLGQQVLPENTGGLLPALHVWRQLLVQGPQRLPNTHYLGSLAPVVEPNQLHDVLSVNVDVVQALFFFDKSSGRLASLELTPDIFVDPCEIYFDDYQPVNSLYMPTKLSVRFGDENRFELTIESFEMQLSDP